MLNYVSISGVEAVPIEFAQSNGAPVLEFGSQLKDGLDSDPAAAPYYGGEGVCTGPDLEK